MSVLETYPVLVDRLLHILDCVEAPKDASERQADNLWCFKLGLMLAYDDPSYAARLLKMLLLHHVSLCMELLPSIHPDITTTLALVTEEYKDVTDALKNKLQID
mgnify:CR=1 FL=1